MAGYVTIAELMAASNKNLPFSDELAAQMAIDGAARAIDNHCNRGRTDLDDGLGFLADTVASARLYSGEGGAYIWIDECVEVTAVAVKESATDSTYTAWASTDWIPFTGDPEDPDYNGKPYTGIMVDPSGDRSVFTDGRYTSGRYFRPDQDDMRSQRRRRGTPTVQITARWGYRENAPPEIKMANIIQATRWLKRGESGFSDATGTAETGILLYRRPLDPDLMEVLENGRYVRPPMGRR